MTVSSITHSIAANNRADVFSDDADRVAFLEALAKTKDRYPFRLLRLLPHDQSLPPSVRPKFGVIDQPNPPIPER